MLFRRLLMAAVFVLALAFPVFAQTGAQELMSREPGKLVELLQNPDAPAFEKAKACQRLAVVGTKDGVPALAALLADEALATYARSALEAISDPSAGEALRTATEHLEGRQLVGAIHSIGRRSDTQAADLLKKLLSHTDPEVVAAAAASLGRIAPRDAVDALTDALNRAQDKAAIVQACLVAAGELADAGRKDDALALYKAAAAAEVPAHLRADAMKGQMRLLGAAAKDLLIEQIRSDDETFFNLGLAMARELPDEEISQALVKELKHLPPKKGALVLLALGDRRQPVPLDVLADARRSAEADVREAAVRVLARSDDPAALALLFDAALGDDDTAAAAQEALKRHGGEQVDAAVLARLAEAAPREKAVLIGVAGFRRIDAARDAVTAALDDENEAVRGAALAALAQMVELKDLSLLVRLAQAPASKETDAARAALSVAALRISDRNAAAQALAATMADAPLDYRVYILELLGTLGGEKALQSVVSAVGADDPQLKDAATRVLGGWPDAAAAPALLKIATDDPERKYQIRALRGYLRIARQLQLPPAERLAMFDAAMKIAQRDEERTLALDILSRVPSKKSLELAVAHLDNAALRDAAATAALTIAPRLVQADPAAVAAAMQKILDAGITGEAAAKARQLLAQAKAQ
ncbi:MAG: HEAT repeat domain-containing protein [Planctomycetes bacterium]|nr:HEAT repeat domain-containing protein [Planctomycetota bacterium]